MKRNVWNLLTAVAFALLLLAVPLYWLIAPKKTFSEAERRNLAEPPKLSAQKLSDWSFDDQAETYLADQLPLRNALVCINAYATLFSGRQVSTDVYCDAEGYLVEAPVKNAPEEVQKRLRRIAALGEKTGRKPYLIAVPSTGFIRRETLSKPLAALYCDDTILEGVENAGGVTLVPLLERFQTEGQTYFYRTDHHWTADGAFAAYEAFMQTAGHEPLKRDAFDRRGIAGYSGSTQSRSALFLHGTDTLELDEPKDCAVKVTFFGDDTVYDTLFFPSHLSEYDWYPVFLDGNHPVTVIENESAPVDAPALLLIKDSFGNSLAPLLVPSYRTIVMVDPRYYRQSVLPLCEQYGIDEILCCYSLDHLTTDESLKILK